MLGGGFIGENLKTSISAHFGMRPQRTYIPTISKRGYAALMKNVGHTCLHFGHPLSDKYAPRIAYASRPTLIFDRNKICGALLATKEQAPPPNPSNHIHS
jgi:hypothetical protein